MSIWKTALNLTKAAERSKNTMVTYLGIEFTEIGDDYIRARMPVDHRTYQAIGIMHGGASCVLAETVGSIAGNFCIDPNEFYCVGLEINTNHIRSICSGYVIGTAKPFHLGRSTQVWGIEILDEKDRLISVSRLTLAILKKQNYRSGHE
ncbi:hotdog fold thioesterase [Coxiella endosymbiont of Amblyomma nuttalli]|uniref:hotdog fold thioesterase n=1 Tax=Coxiella endosymbiont of Amblyomma nuttalli TaxID=2749996 RepID=UPI001BAE09AC|nr:hotdog fold thioesterase [Coxiella endosymbiont of Amblyomma nuttalli]QTS84005.1 Esterase YdiI [Coxiella endosymbiont of Amblyomma nuttalli]